MDVQLIVRELRKNNYVPSWERVETEEALREALQRRKWQLVISDASIEHLVIIDALATTKVLAPDVPVIVVSGSPEHVSSRFVERISHTALSELGAAIERVLQP